MTWLGLLMWRLRWMLARPRRQRPAITLTPELMAIDDDYTEATTVGMPKATDDPTEGIWVH